MLWKGFQRPKRLEFDAETLTDQYGKFSAQPFERGFGTTIGNALRRVLLSAIEGAAVTSVKIDNVLHEFFRKRCRPHSIFTMTLKGAPPRVGTLFEFILEILVTLPGNLYTLDLFKIAIGHIHIQQRTFRNAVLQHMPG